jgi:hypothetical protein
VTNTGNPAPTESPSVIAPDASRLPRSWEIFIPLLLYGGLMLFGVRARLEQMNVDGIIYIRRAQYMAGGLWWESLTGYWSPLISWCIAPLLAMKVDGLLAARLVLAAWGAGWVAAAQFLVRRVCPATQWLRIAVGCVLALVSVHLSLAMITPDVVMASCLLGYLALIAQPGLLRRRRNPLAAGALAGLAFLGKSYALPFFLVHAPVSLLLRAKRMGRPGRWRDSARAGGLLVAGFACLAVPWVTILSIKYGRLTITTVGPIAHAIVGPIPSPMEGRGRVPPDPYMLETEILDRRQYAYWSPFASRENFVHQWMVVRNNTFGAGEGNTLKLGLVPVLVRLDVLRLGAVALAGGLAFSLVAAFSRGHRRRCGRHVPWVLFTAALYCGGFLPIYFEPRYVLPILIPLAIILSLQLFVALRPRPRRGLSGRRLFRGPAIPALVVLSFGWTAFSRTWPLISQPVPANFRQIAQAIDKAGIRGPVGGSNNRSALFVAYHLNQKYASIEFSDDPARDAQMLKELGVRALLVWDNPGRGGGRPAADESENESDSVDTDTTHRTKKRDRNDERAQAAAQAAGWKPALQLRLGKFNKVVVYIPSA